MLLPPEGTITLMAAPTSNSMSGHLDCDSALGAMRSVELFAGAGGLGLGVSRAGFVPAAVIEWNKYCCDTIRENQYLRLKPVLDWPLIEGDVRLIDFRPYQDKIDLVSGGPPCQPFSIGGKSRGSLDSRDMFPQAVRSVREMRPSAFIFENVKGLTRSTFSGYFEYVRLQLTYPELTARLDEGWLDHLARLEMHHTHGGESGLNYRLLSRVVNAADYGVPQRRERVFFVGFRSDLDIEWSFPEPTHSREALLRSKGATGDYWERHKVASRDRAVSFPTTSLSNCLTGKYSLAPWKTVRDAIADLPDPEGADFARIANHRFQPGARSYPGHVGSPLDEPAKTLKAGDHGVPGGENMLVRPDGSIRYFTVRESARLQTFPDEFLFHGSWTETMRQLGNAVPVDLASIIASSVHHKLAHC